MRHTVLRLLVISVLINHLFDNQSTSPSTMAHMHHGRKCPDSATKTWTKHKNWLADLEALAISMLADAEDDKEEIAAILVAQIAVEEAVIVG